MRKLVFFSLLALSAFGVSQEMPPAKDIVITKKVFLIFQAEVKKELKITTDQESKVKAVFGDSLNIDGDRIMISLSGDVDFGQMVKDALKPLDSDQSKRLTEIWIQSLKGAAVGDDEIAKTLELTADQKKAVDDLIEEAGNQIIELYHGGGAEPDQGVEKKSKEIRDKAGEKMLAVLTDDQKKKYEALKGKEFKFKDGS